MTALRKLKAAGLEVVLTELPNDWPWVFLGDRRQLCIESRQTPAAKRRALAEAAAQLLPEG